MSPTRPSTRVLPAGFSRRGAHLYATTHALEELEDRAGRRWLLKDVAPDAVLPEGRGVVPPFLLDPRREVEVYRQLLGDPEMRAPSLAAAMADPEHGECWLIIEKIDGRVLWQVGDIETWCAVAAHLGRVHERLAPFAADPPAHLLRYDRDFHRAWVRRVRTAARGLPPAMRARIDRVTAAYTAAIDDLLGLPTGIIHGELYPSNVLVGHGEQPRITLIDWEMAAVGPYAIDLAALATGWSDTERRAIIGSYAEAAARPMDAVSTETDLAALHLCVRWLGWARDWRAPEQHRQDWLGLAEDLVDRLDA